MKWSDLSQTIGKVAPTLGSLLGGPVGASIGAVVSSALGVGNSAEEVDKALSANPDLLFKLKELEANKELKLQELLLDQSKAELAASTQAISDINKTIQTEAASEHWPTYTWRPAIGFAVAFNIVASSVITLVAYGASMSGHAEIMSSLPSILGALAAINTSALPILGIASWFRGKAQVEDVTSINTPTNYSNIKG